MENYRLSTLQIMENYRLSALQIMQKSTDLHHIGCMIEYDNKLIIGENRYGRTPTAQQYCVIQKWEPIS